MAHVVTEKCQDCRFTDCVEVCPVDCFYSLDNQLIINPDECIDCGACIPECPVEAIYAEDDVPEEFEANIQFNVDKAAELEDAGAEPITEKIDPLPTAEEKKGALGL
ncbi:MAG: ferredoxin [Opitutaceae bacterium]|nr:ferredoxin [Opitutaceae bacterium]|tara:strand:- start:96 stop:416 length:321 start_codon:yes stop_codon:yes gene_type:complete